MGGAHGRGLLCGSPSFSTEKPSSIFVLWFWPVLWFSHARTFRLPFLLFLYFFSSSSRISICRRGFDVSSNGLVHTRLLDANTGRIERSLARVSAGTGVVFSGAINSPTLMDFV
ncbi:hypothetical protein V1477_001657 [Vespula maculifrons]|uniref:Uncharacterized protein n=1 Tax=Vespula maculifrons TaxID=7453 RepID=A0ABD2CYE2_VESMC